MFVAQGGVAVSQRTSWCEGSVLAGQMDGRAQKESRQDSEGLDQGSDNRYEGEGPGNKDISKAEGWDLVADGVQAAGMWQLQANHEYDGLRRC